MTETALAESTVEYSYDAAGNVIGIQSTPGPLTLTAFSPSQGAIGSNVTIDGSGFSLSAGNNIVKFNGVTATVQSASTTELIASVPSGATTGPISVTVDSTTVTSSSNFTVVQGPSISGFSPALGGSGTLVTVSGTALAASGSTTVTLGGTPVVITSIGNTQIKFAVPNNADSGPIQVTTSYGQATSSEDFIVVPSAIGASNVSASAELTAGGSSVNLNTTSTNQYDLFYFHANQGDWLSVQLNSLVTTPSGGSINYYVYSPANVQIASGTVSASNMSIHLPQIPTTGIYEVAFSSGNYTLQLAAMLESDVTTSVGGTPLSLSTTVPGQSKRSIFSASAGQSLGLGLTSWVFSPSTSSSATVTVYSPSGGSFASNTQNCYPAHVPGCSLSLNNLPENGTYQAIVDPPGARTMSVTATLTQDVTATLSENTPYNLNLASNGQRGLLTFTAAAGETVALALNNLVTNPSGGVVNLYVYAPGNFPGAPLVSVSGVTNYTYNLTNLVAGSYTVFVEPQAGATATMTVTLASMVGGALSADGTSYSYSATVPGQNIYLSFSGTAGQNLGLGFTSWAFSPSTSAAATVTVYKPSGNSITSNSCYSSYNPGCSVSLNALPETGTYSVVITPPSNSTTMSVRATLTQDVTATLSENTPYNLNLASNGQRGLLTFTATAGETVALAVSNITTTPTGGSVYVYVYAPGHFPDNYGNGYLTYAQITGSSYTFNLTNLSAGTYTVFVVPNRAAVATMTVTLASKVGGALSTDGTSYSYSATVPGQNIYLSFSGTAGQNLGIGFTNWVFSPSTSAAATVTVYKPSGSSIASNSCYSSYNPGCSVSLNNLPETGTYSVVITPPSNATTMSVRATLTQDVTATLSRNTPYNLNLASNGQRGLLTFTATAGETVALALSNIITTPTGGGVYVYIYAPGHFPDNSGAGYLTYAYITASSYTFNLSNLSAGTYTVFVVPNRAAVATMRVTLTP